jgi:radical SAM protein with 4Fe4S-binding SPASM domain
MKYPKIAEDDLNEFAKNYSKENDDELNGLYAHYNIVKKNVNAKYRSLPEYKEYRNLWRETAVNHLRTEFPLHLDIEVTSYCNLACPMCPRTHRVQLGKWENRMMKLETFKKIIDEGTKRGLKAINLNNFGESFYNKNIIEMIEYAKSKGVIDIMLHTNGTVMNEELAEKIVKSGLDRIIFSLDSITKTIYEKIRVNANFEDTVEKVKTFYRIREKFKAYKPVIRISMVRMKENDHEAKNFENFWGSYADEITYTDYRNQDGLDKVDRYTKTKKENKSYACPALWQRMTINATGEVTACCRDAGKRLTIGKLDNSHDNLKNIWDGKILEESRKLHEAKKAYLIDACNGCDHIRGMIKPEK